MPLVRHRPWSPVMKLSGALAGLASVALLAPLASADVIVRYDTEAITTTQTAPRVEAVDPGLGVTGIDVTRGAGLTPTSASFSLNASGWNDLAADDYFEFGFTTTVPYAVEAFTVGLRSSNTGPGFVNLLYAKDGGAFTELLSVSPVE